MRSLKSTATAPTVVVESASASAPAAAAGMQRSPWHSPVPYLFGGLAAMLGLIAFALLILACSYWKLSGQMNGDNDGDQEDLESGDGNEKKKGGGKGKGRVVYEEQFAVIMAGDHKPTCLAKPVYSRTARLFSDESVANNNGSDDEKAAAAAAAGAQSLKVDLEEADKHQSNDQEESNMNLEQLHLHPQAQFEPESSSSS